MTLPTVLLLGIILSTASCGSGPDGHPLNVAEREHYNRVSACALSLDPALRPAPPPEIEHAAAKPCPTSGDLCCLAAAPTFECPDRKDLNGDGRVDLCSAGAAYQDGVVIVPGDCERNVADEFVHYLYDRATGDPESGHAGKAFVCGGVQ